MTTHAETAGPMLFRPLSLRGVTAKNRLLLSPMCQYSAIHGHATDWHLVHLGACAQGGFGTVMVEATAVSPEGRLTHGDLGLWSDEHVPGLARIAAFLLGQGCVAAIQLGHSGRKGSSRRPWEGHTPLGPDAGGTAEPPWPTIGPTAAPVAGAWVPPRALSEAEMARVAEDFAAAACRAARAGFTLLEVHSAHGYLLHEFLSPLANDRTDAWGGSLENRMRFPLEVVRRVRRAWPQHCPLSVRISAVDGVDGGWTLADSIVYGRALKAAGVDLIDCSSGGIPGPPSNRLPRGPGFQIDYADRLRQETGCATIAVGLIVSARQAEHALQTGRADMIAIGREALVNPHWAAEAAHALGIDADYRHWPPQYGWWLGRRARALAGIGLDPHSPADGM